MAIVSLRRSHHKPKVLAVKPATTRTAAVLDHQVVLDGAPCTICELLWLGAEKRLAIITEQADGSLQGHDVAPVPGTTRNYRTLGLVEAALATKAMELMQQVW